MVFCEDVKISDVIPWAMRGCFQNSGQNCCGVERLFVYESIAEDFISAIVDKVANMVQGCPVNQNAVDCGAMVMDAQITLIQALVDDAVAKGAKVHCGGKRNDSNGGQFYLPTLLSGVSPAMRIWKEEVFGPIMCLITVPGDDDEACVQMVNGEWGGPEHTRKLMLMMLYTRLSVWTWFVCLLRIDSAGAFDWFPVQYGDVHRQ